MSTNFIRSDQTSDTVRLALAPSPGSRQLNWKTWLWLALPVALAAGCASGPSRSASYNFTDAPAPIVAAVSERQAANQLIGNEIYQMLMTDTNIDYALGASVNSGVVSLSGTAYGRVERQRIVDRMWDLEGVLEVKDRNGMDVAPTVAAIH